MLTAIAAPEQIGALAEVASQMCEAVLPVDGAWRVQ